MIRFKDYNATGVAPDGRLYAGDLNQLQDLVAALSDFTQTHDVGTLRIGDSSIQLLKYGAAEGRITAALRVDGVIRGLGGFTPGTFTTAARDAIGAGYRPYGLIIQNTTTNRLEQNIGSDAVPVWVGVGAVDDNSVTLAKMADNSVGAAEIIDGSVGAAEIADGSVGTAELAAGAVTLVKVASDVPVIPVGAVMDWPWASGSIAAWSILPYGQAISRATYAALHALAVASGYAHGAGDTVTTFNVPDYRGRVGAGKDDMGGAAASRITVAISGINGATLGAVGGAQGVTLTSAQIPAHTHPHNLTLPNHTHEIAVTRTNEGGGGLNAAYANNNNVQDYVWQSKNPNSNPAINGGISANTGGDGSHQNVQPTIIVNKIMRAL